VLILSRFAGAAQELDCALIVNPYDTDLTAAAMVRALAMPLEERRERWSALMARIEENTVGHWCASFLEALAEDGFASLSTEPLAPSRDGDSARPSRAARTSAPWSPVRN
jgi:trehalose 6-phosphate synthase